MSFTQRQVLDALSRVKYPGKDKSIVDLQMVSDIRTEGKEVYLSLVFERSSDPLISSVKKACVRAINSHLGGEVQVKGNITVKARQMVDKHEPLPGVKNIVAIASGKGGVGKSTVAANLAVAAALKGLRVGLIDADIFGPSIPRMLDTEGRHPGVINKDGSDIMIPVENYDVKLLSIGYFIDPEDPVVWRGPMATNALRQFLSQADWGELDYMFIDLPPGTSDIHLTMVQEIPVTGAVIVTTPQHVAIADALKGINMFRSEKINVPVVGLIENMAWFTPEELPDRKYYIFGKEGGRQLAMRMNVPFLGHIPLVMGIVDDSDTGCPTVLKEGSPVRQVFMELTDNLFREIERRNIEKPPTSKVKINNK